MPQHDNIPTPRLDRAEPALGAPYGQQKVGLPHYCVSVRIFHDAFGCAAPAAPGPMDDQTRFARGQLSTEEVGELLWALAAGDMIEVMDALGDFEYVTCGAIVACGADLAGFDVPSTTSSTDGPPRFPAADSSMLMVSTLLSGVSAQLMALASNRWDEVAKVSGAILISLGGIWSFFGISEPVRQAILREVHRSNMTKFGADGKPVVNEAGRVVKGPNFEEPDILGAVRSVLGPDWEPPRLLTGVSTPLSGAPR